MQNNQMRPLGLFQRSSVSLNAILPPEVIGIVFDHILSLSKADPNLATKSLYSSEELDVKRCFASCSLVCRYWRDLAETYLNYCLAIRIKSTESQKGKTLCSVSTWLASKPSLLVSVRVLRLVMNETPDGYDPIQLRKLILKFSKLRVVQVTGISFNTNALKDTTSTRRDEYANLPLLNKLDQFIIVYPPSSPPIAEEVQHLLSWLSEVRGLIIAALQPWLVRENESNKLLKQVAPKSLRISFLVLNTWDPPLPLLRCFRRPNASAHDIPLQMVLSVRSIDTLLNRLPSLLGAVVPLINLTLDFQSCYGGNFEQLATSSTITPIEAFNHLVSLGNFFDLKMLKTNKERYWAVYQALEKQLPSLKKLVVFGMAFVEDEACTLEDMEATADASRHFLVHPIVTWLPILKKLPSFSHIKIVFTDSKKRKIQTPAVIQNRLQSMLGDDFSEKGLVRSYMG
ncbi:hypothetical protein BDY19DRAFT_974783 [Irpex rosettiformis]|uniref:Uncharacterized protein n=1 Tax=Irpex rosettiformis TaxID=378272 RepID=A0ACB8TPG1_9APHY|nr:hypothetical protein BDY19DRAFT_974783 [Irpex rosettiformis]